MTRAVLITCEHASAALPGGADLGVSAAVRTSHVGWDAGAARVAGQVARELGCAYVAGAWSRLWVDLNRPAGSRQVVPAVSFGVAVQGNAALSDQARHARVAAYHEPHWRRVTGLVEERARGGGCLHLAIHSFDPAIAPQDRCFEVGVLFDPDWQPEAAIADELRGLVAGAGYETRTNEPYLGTDEGLTTWLRTRFEDAAYTGIEIELNQALATSPARAGELTGALIDAIRRCARRWPG